MKIGHFKSVNNRRFLLPAGLAAIFCTGVIIGWFARQPSSSQSPKALREGGYEYINPVLLCNTNVDTPNNEDTALQDSIKAYLNHASEKDVAVYYLKLLNGGKWVGVNENETFAPASMLKVPTVVAFLKYAEEHAAILDQEVLYDGSFDDNKVEYFKPRQSIRPGHHYSVDQLLTYVIQYSDNNALRLLHTVVDAHDLENIYINLGIQLPTDSPDFMSPKTYSLFLRLLYNSTYLTREMSEKVLRLMDAADFSQGLQGGVPSPILTVEKFGERQVKNDDGTVRERELHDCGIVYTPQSPYVICVMTRGNDFEQLASEIRAISALAYRHTTGSK